MSTTLTAGALAAAAAVAQDQPATTPDQLLADAAREMASVRTFHFEGTEQDADGRTRIVGDFAGAQGVRVTLSSGGAVARMTVLPKAVYLKANARYWRTTVGRDGAAVARKLADRWVKLPASSRTDLGDLADELDPKRVAHCLTVNHGSLSIAGTRTIAGQQATVIVDKGDKPGTAPGELWIAASGRPLPLRERQTGKQRPGKVDARCGDEGSKTRASDLRLSRFDAKVTIRAPKRAITISDGGGSDSGTPA